MTHNLTEKYMQKMIVREPLLKPEKLHPAAKLKWNKMTAKPVPLEFKLHQWPPVAEGQEQAAMTQTIEEELKLLASFKPMVKPLGTIEKLPFAIERTHKGNLPVYTDFRSGGGRQLTVVRKINGDVDKLKQELYKVCSNSEIEEKQGRIEITGKHSTKVKLWLTRLGF